VILTIKQLQFLQGSPSLKLCNSVESLCSLEDTQDVQIVGKDASFEIFPRARSFSTDLAGSGSFNDSYTQQLIQTDSEAVTDSCNPHDDVAQSHLHCPSQTSSSSCHVCSTRANCSPDLAGMLTALYSREVETPSGIGPAFLSGHGSNAMPSTTFIDEAMRSTVVSWLAEVGLEYDLSQDTLHLAVSILDRFLSVTTRLPRQRLQLVGVACMLIASKHEEQCHPSVSAFVSIADNSFTPKDLVRMEAAVLASLSYQINTTTSHTFLSLLRQGLGDEEYSPSASLANYLAELALLDASISPLQSSLVATAALALAKLQFNDVANLKTLGRLAPYNPQALLPCITRLLALQQAAYSSSASSSVVAVATSSVSSASRSLYSALREKYSSASTYYVSTKVPVREIVVRPFAMTMTSTPSVTPSPPLE
jgi:hypothetical protein